MFLFIFINALSLAIDLGIAIHNRYIIDFYSNKQFRFRIHMNIEMLSQFSTLRPCRHRIELFNAIIHHSLNKQQQRETDIPSDFQIGSYKRHISCDVA